MKLLAIFVIMSLATFSFVQAQSIRVKPLSDTEKAVLQTGRELFQARLQADTKTLDRLLADNYVSAIGNNKQTVLKDMKPWSDARLDLSTLKARVFGDSAEVTGGILLKDQGIEIIYMQWVDRLVKRRTGWQSISNRREEIPIFQGKPIPDTELTVLTPLNCDQQQKLQSLNSDEQTYLKFKNATTQPITLRWINYEGQLDPEADQIYLILPGQSSLRITFVTHPFVVTDVAGKCLGIYQPTIKPGIAIIK